MPPGNLGKSGVKVESLPEASFPAPMLSLSTSNREAPDRPIEVPRFEG